MISKFETAIGDFIALPCWAVIAGEGTGSMVSLAFGPMIPRENPLENLNLSKEYRLNRSDYSIYIQFASWVLEQGNEEICSSDSDNSNSGEMVLGLSKLRGLHVHYVEHISDEGLYIDFQNDFTLSILFEAKEIYGDGYDNVTVFYPEGNYTINSDRKLEFE